MLALFIFLLSGILWHTQNKREEKKHPYKSGKKQNKNGVTTVKEESAKPLKEIS